MTSTHLERVLDVAAAVTAREPVDVSRLSNVIVVDVASRTCAVEPRAAYADVLAATAAHGFAPRIRPARTVRAFAAEFFESCLECEIVTVEGDVTRLRWARSDAMPHPRGVLTALTFALVPIRTSRARASWGPLGRGPRRATARRR